MRRNLTTSQLFARFLTFCHLFSTTLISVHLILTLLNSQLSTLLSSYWLISPQFHSSNIFLSPVEVTQVQTCSIAFPFVRSVWFVRVCLMTQRSFYTEEFLHRESVLHWTSFYTEKFLHRANFPTGKFLHRANFYTEEFFHREAFTQTICYTGCAKIEKILLTKQHSQPSCSHYNTIYDFQLQNTIVLRMQPERRGTLIEVFHCDLQTLSQKIQWNYAQRLHKLQLQNRISTPKRKNEDFETLFESNF